MKKNLQDIAKIVAFIFFLFVFATTIMPFITFADVVYSQLHHEDVDTTKIPLGKSNSIFRLGTGLSGNVNEIGILFDTGDTPSSSFYGAMMFDVVAYNDSSYTSTSSTSFVQFSRNGNTTFPDNTSDIYATTSTSIILDPTKYYAFLQGETGHNGNSQAFLQGTTNSLYWATGQMYFGVGTSALADMYFQLSGEFLENNIDQRTRIIEIVQPVSNTLTASTSVTFEYDYYSGLDVFETAGFELNDFTTGQQLITPTEIIGVSGVATFNETMTLTSGHWYGWRPYLRSEENEFIYGDWQSFEVVSRSGQFSPLDPNDANATSTVITRFFSLNQYFQNKFPFAYFYDFKAVLDALPQDQDESSFPTFTYQSPTSSPIVFNVTLLSTTTVTRYVGASTISLIRTVLEAVLWIGFGFMVFYQIKNLLKH